MVKFYNPGPAICEKLKFDNPTSDPKTTNNISYWSFNAPSDDFFDVPTEIELTPDGMEPIQLSVRFADIVQKDWREFGIVRVVPNPKKPIGEDDNVAKTEKEAKEKAQRLWHDFLIAKAREHYRMVEEAHAVGGIPSRARGIYKHALTVLNMEDPADRVGIAVNRNKEHDDVTSLRAVIAQMQSDMQKLTANMAKGK